LSKGYKWGRFLLTIFGFFVLASSLVLVGVLSSKTEGVSLGRYGMITAATATPEGSVDQGGGDGDGGGEDQGDGEGDQNGDGGDGGGETDGDGSADFQPEEETETTEDEETEPEPTPQLDVTPESSPTFQELVEICDNGQDDDNDGQIDQADSDCGQHGQGTTPTPTPIPAPTASGLFGFTTITPTPTPTPTPRPLQGVFAVPEPDCIQGSPQGGIPSCDDPSIAQFAKTCSSRPNDQPDATGSITECVVDRTSCANPDAVVTNVGCHVFSSSSTQNPNPTPSPIPLTPRGPLTPVTTRSLTPSPIPLEQFCSQVPSPPPTFCFGVPNVPTPGVPLTPVTTRIPTPSPIPLEQFCSQVPSPPPTFCFGVPKLPAPTPTPALTAPTPTSAPAPTSGRFTNPYYECMVFPFSMRCQNGIPINPPATPPPPVTPGSLDCILLRSQSISVPECDPTPIVR
jgi:hypothetical protein